MGLRSPPPLDRRDRGSPGKHRHWRKCATRIGARTDMQLKNRDCVDFFLFFIFCLCRCTRGQVFTWVDRRVQPSIKVQYQQVSLYHYLKLASSPRVTKRWVRGKKWQSKNDCSVFCSRWKPSSTDYTSPIFLMRLHRFSLRLETPHFKDVPFIPATKTNSNWERFGNNFEFKGNTPLYLIKIWIKGT